MKKLILLTIISSFSLTASAQLTMAQAVKKVLKSAQEQAAFMQANAQNLQDNPELLQKLHALVSTHIKNVVQLLPHICTDQYLNTWAHRTVCVKYCYEMVTLVDKMGHEEFLKITNLSPEQFSSFMQMVLTAIGKIEYMLLNELAQAK